jgi:hypothetical protein
MTSDVIEDNNIQLTLENVIDALGQTNVEFAMSLLIDVNQNEHRRRQQLTTSTMTTTIDSESIRLNVREYAYYHVLHQLDTSFEANAARANVCDCAASARAMVRVSIVEQRRCKGAICIRSTFACSIGESAHVNVLSMRLLRQWRHDASAAHRVVSAMPLLNDDCRRCSTARYDANDRVVERAYGGTTALLWKRCCGCLASTAFVRCWRCASLLARRAVYCLPACSSVGAHLASFTLQARD